MNATTRLYVFDLGGVLVQNFDPIGAVARVVGFNDVAEFTDRFREPFRRLCTGVISPHEFWEEVGHGIGRVIDEDLWEKHYRAEVVPCVREVILSLRRGARVVAGTNTMASHYAYHSARGDLDVFDAVYASHIMGYLKPQPEFYRYILDAEATAPAATVFIDDMEENVAAARELGIAAVRFSGCPSLRLLLGLDSVGDTPTATGP